mmetsp:Transcript_1498/g.2695  ORF Transcript_1498/g.2695 Transcript_1498/m.2695 type:complete len:105 (+) Transcript_1498:1745-2059(+)
MSQNISSLIQFVVVLVVGAGTRTLLQKNLENQMALFRFFKMSLYGISGFCDRVFPIPIICRAAKILTSPFLRSACVKRFKSAIACPSLTLELEYSHNTSRKRTS